MTIADVLRKYQGSRTQMQYAELLGITQGHLSLIYSGGRNAGLDVQRGFLRAFPEAALEYVKADTASVPDTQKQAVA